MLALVFIIVSSFFIVPKITGQNEAKAFQKGSFTDRLKEFANANQRGPVISDPGSGSSSLDSAEMFEASMREWKEFTYGDPDKTINPMDALGAAKRATAITALRNYYTAEMQYYCEMMKFAKNKEELYINAPDPAPYKIEINVFGDDSLMITAKGNIDNDDELDVLSIDQSGQMKILYNDLAD